MFFSLSMLPPVLVSLLYGESHAGHFLAAFSVVLAIGFFAWVLARRHQEPLRAQDGFLITVLVYVVLGVCGAIPFYLSGAVSNWTDAVFESLSGLTTTGSTILVGLDDMSRSILYYRQQLQWLGGMGIVLLAVSLLPALGVGGMQLYRAEVPTPNKDSKLTPRIVGTARALWAIYLALTITCALAYALAGMSWFDAICHSFSTVAVGGFSTHDQSIGWFDSPAVEAVAVVFMLLCAVNFSLHFIAWQQRSLRHYFQDSEFRFFVLAIVAGMLLVNILFLDQMSAASIAWRDKIFQTVSVATTTGFTTVSFADWPLPPAMFILLLALMGGCAGSVAGGMKVVRVLLIFRQGIREIYRLIHPNAVYHIKLGERVVDENIVHAVWGFFAAFVFLFFLMMLIVVSYNLDLVTAFSAIAATITNLGPGLGEVSSNYSSLPDPLKWLLCVSMLLGRLEIYTLLVLLVPEFWR